MLEDENEGVRQAAGETLGKLEAAALAEHADALQQRLQVTDCFVREAATQGARVCCAVCDEQFFLTCTEWYCEYDGSYSTTSLTKFIH